MVNDEVYVVALTGGIASGKTAVSDLFADLGVPILDTDLIAREVVEPGQAGLEAIVDAFGEEVLTREGRLNRRALREEVFSDSAKRRQLESILHPLIMNTLEQRLQCVNAPYCIVVIPLLAELDQKPEYIDRVLLVDTNDAIRIERLMQRDDMNRIQAERALATQASRPKRLAIADDIIDNSGDKQTLDQPVKFLHQQYLKTSQDRLGRHGP